MSTLGNNNLEIKQPVLTQTTGKNVTAPKNSEGKFTSLFVGLKKCQLVETMWEKFEKYDTHNNNDILEECEYRKSQKDYRIEQRNSEAEIEEMKKLSLERPTRDNEQKLLKIMLGKMELTDDIDEITEAFKTGEKKDFDTILKETLGEEEYNEIANLSKEEKIKFLKAELDEKYRTDYSQEEIENLPDDNVYKQHYNRIKNGDLTESEKRMGLTPEIVAELTPEQLQEYTKRAVELEQVRDFASVLSTAEKDSAKIMAGFIKEAPSKVRAGLISVSLLTAPKEVRKEIANKILADIESGKLDLSEEDKEELMWLAGKLLAENGGHEQTIAAITSETAQISETGQMQMFQAGHQVLHAQHERGEITQEEYDATYVDTYAASAHKMKLASEAYNYIQTNATDSNRNDTMNMLASTAYQIKDEEQRSSAIEGLLKSPYATPEVKESLEKSYRQFIADTAKEVGENAGGGMAHANDADYLSSQKQLIQNNSENLYVIPQEFHNNTAPTQEESQQMSDNIKKILRSDNKQAKLALYSKPVDTENVTQKHQQMQFNQAVLMLNEAIKSGDFDNSEYKQAILKKIGSMDTHTLVNSVILKLSPKAQDYLIKEGVIGIEELCFAINLKGDVDKLPEYVQDQITDVKPYLA